MPMSPRLLRPRSGVFTPTDADARAYITAVQAADGQRLEPAVARAIDRFVIGCKADGIWPAIKSSCILMGARTLNGALVPLVGAAPTNIGPFVAADYSRRAGLIGNNSNKYLDANRSGTADPQDNFHLSVFVSAIGSSVFRNAIGHGGTSNGAGMIGSSNTASNYTARNRCSSVVQTAVSQTAPTFIGCSRTAAASFNFRFNNSDNTNSVASQPPNASPIYVFASSLDGSATANGHTNARIAWYSIGEGVAMSSLNSRVSALYADIGAAIIPQVSNADARDWLNRVYGNGGTVSATTANAVNAFCNAIDAAGIRDRFFRLNLFCGTSDASLTAVRTPLYLGPSLSGAIYGNTTDTNVNFVQGDYAETGASGGLIGNGSSKYLQTGVRLDQLPAGSESNVHLAVYRRTAGNGQSLISSYSFHTSTATDRQNYELALDVSGTLGREVGASGPLGAAYPRFTLATRSSSSSMFTYINGTAGAENASVVAGAATGIPFAVFARNLITGAPPTAGSYSPTFYTTSALGGYSIGASMSPAQVSAYTAAMQAFQAALSRNV